MLIAGIVFAASQSVQLQATENRGTQKNPEIETKCTNCGKEKKDEGMDPKLQLLLSQVANIFMNFVGVVQNPDNASEHVANMFTGAIQMVADAVKSGELSLDATQEEIIAYASRVSRSMKLEDMASIS